MRITDEHGHRWPITERRCPVCSMPTTSDATHPMCAPSRDVGPDAHQQAVALVEQLLGAEVMGNYTTRWLVSDDPLP